MQDFGSKATCKWSLESPSKYERTKLYVFHDYYFMPLSLFGPETVKSAIKKHVKVSQYIQGNHNPNLLFSHTYIYIYIYKYIHTHTYKYMYIEISLANLKAFVLFLLGHHHVRVQMH